MAGMLVVVLVIASVKVWLLRVWLLVRATLTFVELSFVSLWHGGLVNDRQISGIRR